MESRSLPTSLIIYAVMLVRWPWIAKYDALDLDEVMEDADLEEAGQDLSQHEGGSTGYPVLSDQGRRKR